MIKYGKLRHELQVITPPRLPARSDFGEVAAPSPNTASEYILWWAEIEPLTGRESERAKSFGPSVSHKITGRWTHKINAKCRLKYGKRLFDINAAINEEEANRTLICYCTEFPSA